MAPTSITIDEIGITFPVRAVGLQPDGQLEIPDETEVGCYRVWATSGPETLVLITCGGDFNPEIRRYRDNVVVDAVPVG